MVAGSDGVTFFAHARLSVRLIAGAKSHRSSALVRSPLRPAVR
jgi:hypothetical protein